MLTDVRMSLRASLRGAAAFTLLALMLAAFAAACGSDPTPTPTPTPRPTPTPTATATPTPLPPTPTPTAMPEQEPQVPSGDLEITASTTVGELMAALSEEELSCVQEAVGADTFALIKDLPLASVPPGVELPQQCFTPETSINMSIAFMSAEVGGLSADTRNCIAELAAEDPSVLGIGEPPADPAALFSTALKMQGCMTDEEAARFGANSGAQMPPPSVMQCLEKELGGIEDFIAIFAGAEPDPEKMLAMFAAAQTCGLELAPPGGEAAPGQ